MRDIMEALRGSSLLEIGFIIGLTTTLMYFAFDGVQNLLDHFSWSKSYEENKKIHRAKRLIWK